MDVYHGAELIQNEKTNHVEKPIITYLYFAGMALSQKDAAIKKLATDD